MRDFLKYWAATALTGLACVSWSWAQAPEVRPVAHFVRASSAPVSCAEPTCCVPAERCAPACEPTCAVQPDCHAPAACDAHGNGCADANGCAGGAGHECPCYLFGPDEPITLWHQDDCCRVNVAGWVSFGYHNKPTPLSTTFGEGLSFNDVPNRFNNHQTWVYIERALDTESGCWDWGYRADIMYGTDAQKTQAFGQLSGWDTQWDHGVYGWALPQAYAEVGNDVFQVKMGHFYTLVGYEVVPAPGNFFYSHALTMFNSEPFTHTGVITTYNYSDNLTVYAGWTAGWDTGFAQFNDGSNFLGGFSATLSEDVTLTYITTFGNFGLRGDNAYSHSIVMNVALTDKLTYIFQNDIVRVGQTGDDDLSINQYLLYSVNDCLGYGARIEWWKDEGQSRYEMTYGVNYKPHANWIVRPEIRYDWKPADNFTQWTFGIDTVVTF
jgi:hypothetical protein